MNMNKTRLGYGVGRFAFVLMLLGCSLSALADGYVTLTKSSSTSKGFAGADWSETVADPSTRDYLVNNNRVFYTASGEIVNARSLTLGEVGGTAGNFFAYYSATFRNEGIIFANGEVYPRASQDIFSGKATFTSPASAPYRFHGTDYRPVGFTIEGDAYSAATAGILAYSQGTNGFHLTFSGDTSAYLGSVVITSQYNSAGAPWGAELRLFGSASYFGGSIIVRDGATFCPQITTSVGSLTLDEGALLSLVAGNTLTVRTALTVNGGPVPVALSGAPSATVNEVTRYALLTMPSGSDCSASDFVVANAGTSYTTAPDVYMADDGETKTLYAAYYPRISLVSNNDSSSVSAVTNGDYWSDGLAVHGFAHYQVSRLSGTTYISTPYEFDSPLVFPGLSLYLGAYTALNLCSGDYTISNVLFRGGSNRNTINVPSGKDATLRGRFDLGSDTELRLITRGSGVIRLSGPCTGVSSSVMSVYGASSGTDQIRETVVLEGDHSGYAGKYLVTIQYPYRVVFDTRFLALRVSDAASLGGARTEFAYDALKIEHAGRLEAYGSFTLDEPTRGVFISGQGRFYVASGKTMTLKEQLTVNGRVYKEGPGTLALGGALRYLDSEGDVTSTPPADATNRTFYVTSGSLKPVSARSLDGLYVVFSNTTSKADVALRFDTDPSETEMAQYGVINLKADAPLSAVTSAGTIPVGFDFAESIGERFAVPLFTVPASSASSVVGAISVPGRLTVGDRKYLVAVEQAPVVVDAVDAVTISAVFTERPSGLVVTFR